jgi:hypothetical protein
MNRTSELFDDRIAEWLEDDPVDAPPQLLETVLAAAPSIQQRRSGVAWRQPSMPLPVQLAAAVAVLVVASVLGLVLLRGPDIGPKSSPTPPAGLTERVDAPLHFYSINLPPGWDVTLATGSGRPDIFQGPEGSLTATFGLIPSGTSQDAWADAYFSDRMRRVGGTCAGLDPGSYDPVRVGSENGRLYALPCSPHWLVMTAIGDRAYDLEFSRRGGVAEDVAIRLFRNILLGITFDQGPTPPLALSTFTSSRYGFSIGYPTGWKITESKNDLGGFEIPWASGTAVDLIEGPGSGAPGQPADGALDVAASTVPPGTTIDQLRTNTASVACGGPDTSREVSVDGKAGLLITYDNCQGDFHQWVLLLDGTRAYHILWFDSPGTQGFSQPIFEQVLATFRSAGTPATPPATQAATGTAIPDDLIGAWHHAAPGWWWFLRAGDAECVQAVRTDGDCVVWQRGTTPKEIGGASIVDGNLQVAWKSGFCTRLTSTYSIARQADSLNLVDIGGGCEGGNFALTRAGTGSTPTAPPPPTP